MTDDQVKNNKLRVNFEIGLGQLLHMASIFVAIFGALATGLWWFSGFVTSVNTNLGENTKAIDKVTTEVKAVEQRLGETAGQIIQLHYEVASIHTTVNRAGRAIGSLRPLPLPLPVTVTPAAPSKSLKP